MSESKMREKCKVQIFCHGMNLHIPNRKLVKYMKKCRNLVIFSRLECSEMLLVSKNRNDVSSLYGSDESSSSSSKLHSSYSPSSFCFFRFGCSTIYLNFIQFIIN